MSASMTAPPAAPAVPSPVTTLGELLPTAARRFADRTALIVEGRSFTFAELDSLASRVAHGLVSLGVQPGDRVTLYGPNCWEWVVAYYAIAKTGAVVNPISSMFTPEEVRYVVADSGARVVVASVDKGGSAARPGGRRRRVARRGAVGRRRAGGCDIARRRGSATSDSDVRASAPRAVPIWRRSVTRQGRRVIPRVRCRASVRSISCGRRHGADGRARSGRSGRSTRLPMAARLRLVRVERGDDGRIDVDHGAAVRRARRSWLRSRRIGPR